MSAVGLGVAVLAPAPALPAVGARVTVHPAAHEAAHAAVVRHVGRVRDLPLLGLSLVPDTSRARDARFGCPEALPAFASAPCPWFFRERLSFRIARAGAEGMTLRAVGPSVALLSGMELEFSLHLVFGAVDHVRGRVTGVRRPYIDIAWVDPPRALHRVLSDYLLATDATLTPALLRATGLAVGNIQQAVTYEYATPADHEEVLALRLRAHQAQGHLGAASVADLRSPFDAHARHLTCRFGGRIVGYVRVIFVDGEPAKSQYVSWGGHEVPQWLWDAGFVEAGAGAMDPDFQRAGLFLPLMAHAVRVAVQSGHRYVLGACDDELLGMYRDMGFTVLETRLVEPKPGWRFRSHLIVLDAEQLAREAPATPTIATVTSAIDFAAAA